MEDLVVFCAGIVSVRSGNFGWAKTEPDADVVDEYDSSSPADLADAVVGVLEAAHPVALGFECPPFVPVPPAAIALGAGRSDEGNRAWSAGGGAGALATGLVQMTWVLERIRVSRPQDKLYFGWSEFAEAAGGLLLWEAFVSGIAKGESHVEDAAIAVSAFVAALPIPPPCR